MFHKVIFLLEYFDLFMIYICMVKILSQLQLPFKLALHQVPIIMLKKSAGIIGQGLSMPVVCMCHTYIVTQLH